MERCAIKLEDWRLYVATGDIIFTRGSGKLAQSIEFFQKQRDSRPAHATHVMMALEPGLLIESTPPSGAEAKLITDTCPFDRTGSADHIALVLRHPGLSENSWPQLTARLDRDFQAGPPDSPPPLSEADQDAVQKARERMADRLREKLDQIVESGELSGIIEQGKEEAAKRSERAALLASWRLSALEITETLYNFNVLLIARDKPAPSGNRNCAETVSQALALMPDSLWDNAREVAVSKIGEGRSALPSELAYEFEKAGWIDVTSQYRRVLTGEFIIARDKYDELVSLSNALPGDPMATVRLRELKREVEKLNSLLGQGDRNASMRDNG